VGNKISRWAERQLPRLRSTGEKLVLMVLANTADHDGLCPAETSIATVAQRTTLAKSSAARALLRLRDAGVLHIEPQHDETGATIKNVYQLAIKGGTENEYTPVPKTSTPPVPKTSTDPYSKRVPPVPGMSTPLTCENAEGVLRTRQPTSSIHPSDVAAPRTPAPARTPTRVHDAPAREQPPPEKTQRRRALEHLDATAHHPDTHRLITAWISGHTTQQSRTLIEQMTRLVDGCVRGGYDTDCLAAALATWNARPDLGSPRALQFLYDDAVSRKNGGADPDAPLIDHNGYPRINPQGIPDDYLTRAVVDRVLGPDSQPPARYPGDADDIDYTDPAAAQARRDFFAAHAETRLSERRAEVRRVLVRAWNRRGAASA
jgi:hypothetical protein